MESLDYEGGAVDYENPDFTPQFVLIESSVYPHAAIVELSGRKTLFGNFFWSLKTKSLSHLFVMNGS